MMANDDFAYFGYGSLVNRQTLRTQIRSGRLARLVGWRRCWRTREARADPAIGGGVALLSVRPSKADEILGLLIVDDAANISHIDQREAYYDRIRLGPGVISHHDPALTDELPVDVDLYVGRAGASAPGVLLQSYLDAVLLGFLAEFGEAGVRHFLETTDGFDRPIIADRFAPRYPRHVAISRELAAWFDDLLRSAGVRFDDKAAANFLG